MSTSSSSSVGFVGTAVEAAMAYAPSLATLRSAAANLIPSMGNGVSRQPIRRIYIQYDPIASVFALAIAGVMNTPGKLMKMNGYFNFEKDDPQKRHGNGDMRADLLYFDEAIPYMQYLYPLVGAKESKVEAITSFWNYVKAGISEIQKTYDFPTGDPYIPILANWRTQIDNFLITRNHSQPIPKMKQMVMNEGDVQKVLDACKTALACLQPVSQVSPLPAVSQQSQDSKEDERALPIGSQPKDMTAQAASSESLDQELATLSMASHPAEVQMGAARKQINSIQTLMTSIQASVIMTDAERLEATIRGIWKKHFIAGIGLLKEIERCKNAKLPESEAKALSDLKSILQANAGQYSKFAITVALNSHFPYTKEKATNPTKMIKIAGMAVRFIESLIQIEQIKDNGLRTELPLYQNLIDF